LASIALGGQLQLPMLEVAKVGGVVMVDDAYDVAGALELI